MEPPVQGVRGGGVAGPLHRARRLGVRVRDWRARGEHGQRPQPRQHGGHRRAVRHLRGGAPRRAQPGGQGEGQANLLPRRAGLCAVQAHGAPVAVAGRVPGGDRHPGLHQPVGGAVLVGHAPVHRHAQQDHARAHRRALRVGGGQRGGRLRGGIPRGDGRRRLLHRRAAVHAQRHVAAGADDAQCGGAGGGGRQLRGRRRRRRMSWRRSQRRRRRRRHSTSSQRLDEKRICILAIIHRVTLVKLLKTTSTPVSSQ
mmetsp:Transcript_34981/g.85721  ORF Transcript_34981/g.85721 Transcript_34981/m.85721 type:complete len:255 (-) Transcript_34981:430-1194(-)